MTNDTDKDWNDVLKDMRSHVDFAKYFLSTVKKI
jgi:hypothetical protein